MKSPPTIFLLGPPGAGKTTLGSWACKELGLAFLDLADVDLEQFSRVVGDTAADVVAIPWALQHEHRALALVRKAGVPLLLWAHPEDMQARSGRDERLFTPVPRLKIRGGFGRNGTGCHQGGPTGAGLAASPGSTQGNERAPPPRKVKPRR